MIIYQDKYSTILLAINTIEINNQDIDKFDQISFVFGIQIL